MRTVKLGLSLRSNDQHAERISCKRIFVAHHLHLVHRSTAQTKQLIEHCALCEPSQRFCLIEVLDILIIKQYVSYGQRLSI